MPSKSSAGRTGQRQTTDTAERVASIKSESRIRNIRANGVPLFSALVLALLAYAYLVLPAILAGVFLSRAAVQILTHDWLWFGINVAAALAMAMLAAAVGTLRAPLPQGQPVSEVNEPLIGLIEKTRVRHGARRPNRILFGDRVDVGMQFTPRNGYCMANARTLIIGVPALQLLSPTQFEALLARRLAQGGTRGSRVAEWLTERRSCWSQLLQANRGWRNPGAVYVRVFLKPFMKVFTPVSATAERLFELRGDAAALDGVSDRAAVESMCATVIAQRYLDEVYYPVLISLARKRPEPTFGPYGDLHRRFNRYWSDTDARRWIDQACAVTPRRSDPQPTLVQRLAEVGHSRPRRPGALRQPASSALLGESFNAVVADQDRLWIKAMTPRWRAIHQVSQRELARLRELQRKSRSEDLVVGESRELATLVERCFGRVKAAPFYRQLADQNPRDANVNFAAGRFLLSAGDAHGVGVLNRATQLDGRFADRARGLIAEFQAAREDEPTAEESG